MTTAAITDEQHHVCRLPRDQDPRNQGRVETCPTCRSEFTLTITHPRELGGRAWIAWIRTHEPEDRVSPASRETHGDGPALPVRRDGGDSDTAADPSPTDSGAGVDTGEAVAAAEMSARAPVPAPLSPQICPLCTNRELTDDDTTVLAINGTDTRVCWQCDELEGPDVP